MTRWLWLVAVLPGGLLLVAGGALYWCWRRRNDKQFVDAHIELLIKPPVRKFAGHDEGLRKRTADKRAAAARMRGRALQVESGAPVSQLLRRVK